MESSHGKRSGTKALLCCWRACCLFLIFWVSSKAYSESFSEHQVKAAFLFQFIQYIEWPPEAFASTPNQIVIGVLNGSDLYTHLTTVQGKPTDGKTLSVKRLKDFSDLSGVHILFVSHSITVNKQNLFSEALKKHILTVGEIEKFAEEGGIINFYIENEKIRFEINLDAAKQSNLTISSKLLRLAKIVSGQKK